MLKPLKGIHHVTAITSSAEKIYHFFTYILGLRLVKKTINQDDIETYHLFFADDTGSAGTDMTFFDFKGSRAKTEGTNQISVTGFRVPSDEALLYYQKRFKKYEVKHQDIKTMFGKKVLTFEDFDHQKYALFSDEQNTGIASGTPWLKGPVPNEYAITGLGPIELTVSDLDYMDQVLTKILTFKKVLEDTPYYLYETGEGGNGASVIIKHDRHSPQAQQGYGAVHHVAFRVDDVTDIKAWIDHLKTFRAPHSGLVDRFYFNSLYTRFYANILFEFATEGPGFIDDEETYETLGEELALPPRFRNKRQEIESHVRHIDTKRSNQSFEKEYL
ncbi:MAG: ring-cleaving dioxygenase [Acholeplasmataceae bacterium]